MISTHLCQPNCHFFNESFFLFYCKAGGETFKMLLAGDVVSFISTGAEIWHILCPLPPHTHTHTHQDSQMITIDSLDYIWLFVLAPCSTARETILGKYAPMCLIALSPSSPIASNKTQRRTLSVLHTSAPNGHETFQVSFVKIWNFFIQYISLALSGILKSFWEVWECGLVVQIHSCHATVHATYQKCTCRQETDWGLYLRIMKVYQWISLS